MYLVGGMPFILEKSKIKLAYKEFVRLMLTRETSEYLYGQKNIHIKRQEAIPETDIAWKLIIYILYLVIIGSSLRKRYIKK